MRKKIIITTIAIISLTAAIAAKNHTPAANTNSCLLYTSREQMYRYRVEYLKDPKNYPMLVKEHDAIYRALEARNLELVTTEMHTHVANQAVAVKAVIQRQDEEKK